MTWVDLVAEYCDHIVMLQDGRVQAAGPPTGKFAVQSPLAANLHEFNTHCRRVGDSLAILHKFALILSR